MTKVQLTLKYLKEAGTNGITGLDLDRLVVQKRTAARIQDLEDMGYVISSTPIKQLHTLTRKYTLISSPFPEHKPIQYEYRDNIAIPIGY